MKIYFPKGQLSKISWMIFGDNQFMSKHTFYKILQYTCFNWALILQLLIC